MKKQSLLTIACCGLFLFLSGCGSEPEWVSIYEECKDKVGESVAEMNQNKDTQAMSGMLEPIYEERLIGKAEVRAVFRVRGRGKVLGCLVLDGEIRRDAPAKIIRNNNEHFSGRITSLKRFQEDVPEVRMGYECGIGVDGFNDPQEGDIVEAYEMVRVR